jgi:hypothetical protein
MWSEGKKCAESILVLWAICRSGQKFRFFEPPSPLNNSEEGQVATHFD